VRLESAIFWEFITHRSQQVDPGICINNDTA